MMKLEASGGRHGPFNEGYCPHLVIVGKKDWLGIRVVRCPEFVHLGEEKEIEFELMYSPGLDYRDLVAGVSFAIHEGSKVVGTGVVLA